MHKGRMKKEANKETGKRRVEKREFLRLYVP